jgi:DNA-binding transcriptional MerR regulator
MPLPLWTIRKIADELGIPESTVRYYRDQFERHIPAVGRARRRRYAEPAVAVLRFIAEAYASGQQREDIAAALDEMRGDGTAAPQASGFPVVRDAATAAALEQLMAGEVHRQEALWHLAQQVTRIGEALVEQQGTLGEIVHRLEVAGRSLPAPSVERRAQPPGPEPEALADLKKELETERELVERLRRAKLDLERQLLQVKRPSGAPPPRPSVVSRLLGRERAAD